MKPIWTVVLLVLLAGNFVGGFILYKAYQLRDENRLLQKYLDDLMRKNRELSADYPGMAVYRDENRRLLDTTTAEDRRQMCIFYGASITKGINADSLLPEFRIVNRGIGAQSSTQLLARFASDVLELQPGKVVIKICAGNFKPDIDNRIIWDEFETMCLAAQARGIEPIVATILPVPRKGEEFEGFSINDETRKFNARAKEFAQQHGFRVVDYYAAVADAEGFLPDELARDAIHPNGAGNAKLAEAFRAAMK